jgi:AbrB family looped-hinge helix DNA binding protein
MFFIDLSPRNQITLPAEYRHRLGLKPKDRLAISEKDGQLILRKAPDLLALKGSLKGLRRVDERAAAMDAACERSLGILRHRTGSARPSKIN